MIRSIGFAYVLFFRQRSMKDERRDRETCRGQNRDEISHDFLGWMIEICEPLKIEVHHRIFSRRELESATGLVAEAQLASPLHRMCCWRLTTER
jgi:hypothetical protein